MRAQVVGDEVNFSTINDLGQVIGYSIDEKGFFHGFVRYPEGRVKTIDAPGAGTGQGTVALAINTEGTIVGQYEDANSVFHAFVRELARAPTQAMGAARKEDPGHRAVIRPDDRDRPELWTRDHDAFASGCCAGC